MFGPFYSTVFLAFESGNVIGLRIMKMMSGGSGSHDEAHLISARSAFHQGRLPESRLGDLELRVHVTFHSLTGAVRFFLIALPLVQPLD